MVEVGVAAEQIAVVPVETIVALQAAVVAAGSVTYCGRRVCGMTFAAASGAGAGGDFCLCAVVFS